MLFRSGKSEMLFEGSEIALLAVGSMVETGVQVYEKMKEEGMHPSLVNARFVKPLDTRMLDRLAKNHRLLVTMEENVKTGGFGSAVLAYMSEKHPQVQVKIISLPDQFIIHGSPELLKKTVGIDKDSIYTTIKEAYKE